jgi:hypothetical protein
MRFVLATFAATLALSASGIAGPPPKACKHHGGCGAYPAERKFASYVEKRFALSSQDAASICQATRPGKGRYGCIFRGAEPGGGLAECVVLGTVVETAHGDRVTLARYSEGCPTPRH